MGDYFLDTSAAVKRYVAETGSGWVTALSDPAAGNRIWLATLTRVETLAAFYLRVRTGSLTQTQARQAERVFRRELPVLFRRVALRATVVRRAMRLVSRHPLRAYDALQLAAALDFTARRISASRPIPLFVCADQRLNRVAAAEGLTVDDPNHHP